MSATDGEAPGRLLDEQRAYYRALAADYLNQALDLPGGDEVTQALDGFQPTGSVLELACGPGVWTGQLLRHATEVTAVDASPEMLAIAAARVGNQRVRFLEADLFTWQPDRRYDVVFFGFGSHTSRPNALHPSGRLWLTASNQRGACSSPTTPTAPQTSSWKARRRRPSVGSSLTERLPAREGPSPASRPRTTAATTRLAHQGHARLRARPAWRAWTDEKVAAMLAFNQWVKDNAATTVPPMQLLDTGGRSVQDSAARVRAWVLQRQP